MIRLDSRLKANMPIYPSEEKNAKGKSVTILYIA